MTATAHPLDIDMGNSRTKWRCGSANGALPSPQLPELAQTPCRIRVATVLRNRQRIACAVEEQFGVVAEFASVTPSLQGVQCGYREPNRLGVDRWLSTVAAWRQVRRAAVVVGAGTAATMDFVHADGRHEGGYIVPGLRLMQEALDRNTADVRVARDHWAVAPKDTFANVKSAPCDTQTSVAAGTLLMLCTFVNTAVADFATRCEGDPAIFLTGGDAPLLAAHLTMPVRLEPHLVLEGLAIALP